MSGENAAWEAEFREQLEWRKSELLSPTEDQALFKYRDEGFLRYKIEELEEELGSIEKDKASDTHECSCHRLRVRKTPEAETIWTFSDLSDGLNQVEMQFGPWDMPRVFTTCKGRRKDRVKSAKARNAAIAFLEEMILSIEAREVLGS